MKDNNYLNEEKYQKAEKAISFVAIIVLIIGLCIGGFLIYKGVAKPETATVDELQVQLETKKQELESKGLRYSSFAKYSDGEVYDLKIIIDALNPSFNHCAFDEYKNNSITKDYCSAKNSTGDFASTSSIMFGAFICIAAFIIAGSIFAFAKRRHILAFSTQQAMPVVKEGIDEIAPTIGGAAEHIAKGIKKGLDDTDKENEDHGSSSRHKTGSSSGHSSSSISHSSNGVTSHNLTSGNSTISHRSDGVSSHSFSNGSSSISHHSDGSSSHSITTGNVTISHNSDGSTTHTVTN